MTQSFEMCRNESHSEWCSWFLSVANLSEDKTQSQEEDDTEYGQAAGNGHTKEHGKLLLLTCVECEHV